MGKIVHLLRLLYLVRLALFSNTSIGEERESEVCE